MINGGLLALLTRFSIEVFNEGGDLGFRLHFYPDKESVAKWMKPFTRSVLQSHLPNHSKFEFEKDPYAHMPLFPHFKMVKHRNKLHIQNPCIFLIILDILFVQFGVKMN